MVWVVQEKEGSLALHTDLYQISMALSYMKSGKADEQAVFELCLRALPPNRNYLVVTGISEALQFASSLRFTKEQIDYLKSLPQFSWFSEREFARLASFRFTGKIIAVKDGTIMFQNEPILYVVAPRWQGQLLETALLGIIRAHTRHSSKASRVVDAAGGAEIYEFGSRHISPELAVVAAKEACVSGCAGTSNVAAGMAYGILVKGTMAHSFVMGFASEAEAFRAYASAYPDSSVFLVDTYDVEKGVENAIGIAKEMERLGHRLCGIRIDSGDLASHSKMARRMLGNAALSYVKIMLSGDLDEHKLSKLAAEGAPFDSAGVGKAISVCDDSPHIDMAYKLCEHELGGKQAAASKASEGKKTLPRMKQVFRFAGADGNYLCDEICLFSEKRSGICLLQDALPSLFPEAASHVAAQKKRLPARIRGIEPAKYEVKYSSAVAEGKQKVAQVGEIRRILVCGLQGYMRENGFTKCVLGLSGGIDSALAAAIAAEAAGKENVLCAFMPSCFTSKQSIEDAAAVAKNLGCRLITMPIDAEYSSYLENLAPHLKKGHAPNVVEENLQARIRANLLYAISNEHGHLVLNTSNKSESLTGYGTLYGDMAGGYGVIADIPKTAVYALARHLNESSGKEMIPQSVLSREPTAELCLGQKDSDSLPPYPLLDKILFLYEEGFSEREIAARGFDFATVQGVFARISAGQHKRRMAPPCAKVDANLYKQLVLGN